MVRKCLLQEPGIRGRIVFRSDPLMPERGGAMWAKAAAAVERVTEIESGLSAWEAVPSVPVTWPDLRGGGSANDRERPLVTGFNGPLMARRTAVRTALKVMPYPSPVLLDSCRPQAVAAVSRLAKRPRAAWP
jgi:hypothetical protein